MSDNARDGLLIDGQDPRLVELADKIRALLAEYRVAGAFQLASSTHAEFGVEFPTWSAVQIDGAKLRIRSALDRDGPTHLESSLHLLLAMRDTVCEQAGFLITVAEAALKALGEADVLVEHKTLQERKAEQEGAS